MAPSPSTAEMMAEANTNAVAIARLMGRQLELLGELDRRRAWGDAGATSLPAWAVEEFGISSATAKGMAHVAGRLYDLPQLAEGLKEGELSFDKVAAVADLATPESDDEWRQRARRCSVHELRQLAKRSAGAPDPGVENDRRSLRFNGERGTITVLLPPEAYAECKAILEKEAKAAANDGETRWDQRLADAFLSLLRNRTTGGRGTSGHYLVVIHAPLSTFIDPPSGTDTTGVGGELERGGLLDRRTVRRVAADASVVLALDDDVGHTMYEGRVKRFPTPTQRREIWRRDRACRFGSCTNTTFTNVHHLREWHFGGTTDLSNLALLCEAHHHMIHENRWNVRGDANAALTFQGPNGRVITSRPSPVWAP